MAAPGRRPGRAGRDRRRDVVRDRLRLRPRRLAFPHVSSGPGMVRMDERARQEASAAINRFSAAGGRRSAPGSTSPARCSPPVPQVTQRHAIPPHRRREPRRAELPRRRHRSRHRLLPVRLPRCRHGLAGRGGPADRPGATRDRRHHPGPAQMQAQFQEMMRASMARGVADAQLRVWAPQGCPDPLGPPGLAHGRGPHRPAGRGQRPDRRLPHGRLGRRVPRLPRRRPGRRQGDRPGAARRPGPASRSATTSWPRAWSRRPGRGLRADRADRPAGRTTPARPSWSR